MRAQPFEQESFPALFKRVICNSEAIKFEQNAADSLLIREDSNSPAQDWNRGCAYAFKSYVGRSALGQAKICYQRS